MKWFAYLPAAVWIALLLYVGQREFPVDIATAPALDKLVHLVLYGVLGVLLAWGWHRAARRPAAAVVLIAGVLVGGYDEMRQRTIPSRAAEAIDWAADAAGVAAGFLITVAMLRPPKESGNE